MATLMENSNRIRQAIEDIRSAIIAKGGTAPTGRCETYADAVRSIPQGSGGGTDVSDTTATEEDVLLSKVFHKADGSRAVGTLVKGIDVSDTTATVGAVLRGRYFHRADGALVEGDMMERHVHDYTIRPESGRAFSNGYYPDFELDVDLTASDVTPEDVLVGKKFYDAENNLQTGTLEAGASDATSGSLDVEYRNIYTIDTGLGSELQHFNLYFKSTAKPSSGNILSSADWNADDPTRYLEGYVYGTSTNHEGGWNLLSLFAPASSYPQSHQAIIDVTDGLVTIKTAGTANPGNGHITWMATKAV